MPFLPTLYKLWKIWLESEVPLSILTRDTNLLSRSKVSDVNINIIGNFVYFVKSSFGWCSRWVAMNFNRYPKNLMHTYELQCGTSTERIYFQLNCGFEQFLFLIQEGRARFQYAVNHYRDDVVLVTLIDMRISMEKAKVLIKNDAITLGQGGFFSEIRIHVL